MVQKNNRLRRELILTGAIRPGLTPLERATELAAKGFHIAAHAIRTVPVRRRLSRSFVVEA